MHSRVKYLSCTSHFCFKPIQVLIFGAVTVVLRLEELAHDQEVLSSIPATSTFSRESAVLKFGVSVLSKRLE